MGDWTTTRVEDRLESAADVFRTLPGVMPQGFFNAWPEYFHSFADKVGQEPQMRQPREMGISRATANRRWQYGIAVMVWRLNGKSVHERLSRQHVISKA